MPWPTGSPDDPITGPPMHGPLWLTLMPLWTLTAMMIPIKIAIIATIRPMIPPRGPMLPRRRGPPNTGGWEGPGNWEDGGNGEDEAKSEKGGNGEDDGKSEGGGNGDDEGKSGEEGGNSFTVRTLRSRP